LRRRYCILTIIYKIKLNVHQWQLPISWADIGICTAALSGGPPLALVFRQSDLRVVAAVSTRCIQHDPRHCILNIINKIKFNLQLIPRAGIGNLVRVTGCTSGGPPLALFCRSDLCVVQAALVASKILYINNNLQNNLN
jgi:hypothetical protein